MALAYIDFVTKQLIRDDLEPAELPDDLHVRLLEESLRKDGWLSSVDSLRLPRFKTKLAGDVTAVGDPCRAFRHDRHGLRKFLRLAGIPIRIKTERGRIRADFDPKKFHSNVVEAANLAREARKQLHLSNLLEAYQFAVHALVLDPDCIRAAAAIVKVAQQGIAPLNQEDTLRAELALARGIIISVAAILRLRTKLAAPFKQIALAHQRALRILNWGERSWLALRSAVPSGDEFRRTLAALLGIAVVAGRGEGDIDLRDLTTASPMVALANGLLAGRLNCDDPDRPSIIRAVIPDIVRLILIYGVLPAAISEEAFVSQLHDFLDRRIDWSSILGRSDRRSIEFDDETFEPDEDDEH